MPFFQYKAIAAAGGTDTGTVEANSRPEAASKVKQLGLRPVRLEEISTPEKGEGHSGRNELKTLSFPLGGKRVTFSMLENFTRLLSSLLSAGVPLSKALVVLYRETSAKAAQAEWKKLHDLVVDGLSLSEAMSRSPKTFTKVYTAMVEAGETGGFLDVVLSQIADFQSRDKELKGKVVTAMIYPALLFLLAIGVLIFLMVFFIPKFKTLFEGFDSALPLLTQVIVKASELSIQYGAFILLGVGAIAYGASRWLSSKNGKRQWEKMMLVLPVIGPLSSRFAMARFCRMLGTLVHSGVPLVGGLNVARRSIGNQILTDAISDTIERVKKGETLAKSLSNCKALFSGATIEMISIAEESGKLDGELLRLAEVTEKELDQQLKSAVALMEPLMLFLTAAFIGTIFIGMVIPIFTIQDYIK